MYLSAFLDKTVIINNHPWKKHEYWTLAGNSQYIYSKRHLLNLLTFAVKCQSESNGLGLLELTTNIDNKSHVTRKPVSEVCDQVRLKLACSATGTSWS